MPEYPVTAFYFSVSIEGSTDQATFQEASGISAELGVEEVAEGGENRFKHKLPKQTKFPNLVLKRGLVAFGSALVDWCQKTVSSDMTQVIEIKQLSVSLLNSNGDKMMGWNFVNAYPVKWIVSDIKSQDNALTIESIEFAYTYFTRTT